MGSTCQVDKWLLSPGGSVAARSLFHNWFWSSRPCSPVCLFRSVQGARGEAYPLTPSLPIFLTLLPSLGLGGGYTTHTVPAAVVDGTAPPWASNCSTGAGYELEAAVQGRAPVAPSKRRWAGILVGWLASVQAENLS